MARRDKKGKKNSKFNYQGRTKDDVRSAANQKAGSFDSYIKEQYKTYKPRDGKNLVRILPPTWEDARHYAYPAYLNYGIGGDNATYLSLHKMKGEPDPLEEARREAQKDKDEKLAKALEAKKRPICFVIDRYDEDAGPQLWPMPWTVDRDIANLCFDEDTNEVILIDHPEDGCDVRFYKEGTGRNTNYNAAKMKVLKSSPLSEDEDQTEEWLEYITDNPVPDCLQYYDYEHIEAVFGGQARTDDDDDDDDDDKKSKKNKAKSKGRGRDDDDDDEDDDRKRRSKAKSKSKRRDDDDDDDEDDEDEDDDDEDDRRKSKSKKTSSKSKRRDDDDDDDDEDEDDEDEDDEDDDDEDDRRKSKSKSKGKSSSKSKRRDDDDDDEDDDDDDDDEDDDEDEDEDDRKSKSKDKGSSSRADRIKARLNANKDKRKKR